MIPVSLLSLLDIKDEDLRSLCCDLLPRLQFLDVAHEEVPEGKGQDQNTTVLTLISRTCLKKLDHSMKMGVLHSRKMPRYAKFSFRQ